MRSLLGKWLAKVTTIQEANDLSVLSLEQLIGPLMTHEMLVDSKEESTARTRSIVMKVEESDEEDEKASLQIG